MELPRKQILELKTRLALSMSTLTTGVGDFSFDFDVAAETPEHISSEETGIFELADLDEPPRPILRLDPAYPREARARGVEGFVEVTFVITPAGRVTDFRVIRSQPGRTFVDATRAAVSRWRFTAPQKGGKPVAMRARQVIHFQLK
jgi:TonB family protein